MGRRVLYVAHPLAPTPEEVARLTSENCVADCQASARDALRRNIDLALRWLAWLRASFPDGTFIAPWIATVMSLHGDDSPELREAGLRDDCATVERCDGIVLCGSRVSSGMAREADHWLDSHDYERAAWGPEAFRVDAAPLAVFDLTKLGLREPPAVVTGMTLDAWLASVTVGAP